MKQRIFAFFIIASVLLGTISPQTTAAAAEATANSATEASSTEDSSVTWPAGPTVYAEAAIVMEASTGLILYEKNAQKTHYPASITKIMTALLAIENSSMGDIVTFSKNAVYDVDLDSSRIGIDVGEQLTMQQCLYAILLESANEVTYAVAEHVAGSIPAFAEMMNERAKSLGCVNTNFVNPHGLHDEKHYTSAYDMALITREAMKNATFRKIFNTRTYQIPPTNIQSETRYLRNHHRFVLKQDYLYNDCIGGKTGYTSIAKYTLVSVAKRGDLELICVVMRDDSNAHQYTDTQKLFDYGFDNFSIYPINDLEAPDAVTESPMFTKYNALLSDTQSPINIDKNGYLILPNSASFKDAEKEVTFYSPQDGTDAKPSTNTQTGDKVIGKISYTYDGKYVGGANILYKNTNPLVLTQDSEEKPADTPSETSPPEKSKSPLVIIICVAAGLLVLAVALYYFIIERPRLKRRRAYYRKRAHRKYHDDNFLDL
ncbi:MAG TPA: D-alanyl-D-alanine carboxypeptidase [Clostridiales bacterium]|nr:D-alanyl-D-alanine carboxypeptidase [Clostridiales bacterium]